MRFSLQNLVRQTLAEADRREHIKLAAGPCPECGKSECDCPAAKKAKQAVSETSSTPERNEEGSDEEGEKTSSMFVEKLASAVDYCNDNFLKDAAETNVGPGDGTGALPLNSPTAGAQSEETGQATPKQQPPMKPGSDAKSPGQTNPETALETDINDPPGGSGEQPQMKQAAVAERVGAIARRGKALLSGSKLKQLRTNMSLGGTAGLKKELGKETAKVWGTRAAALAGAGGAAKGVHSLATGGKKKKASADLSRVRDIMDKMAADSDTSSISAGTSNPHQSSPPGVSAAGEGKMPVPSEVAKQESLIASNEAATNYDKGQAKAVPKARMGEVLSEPAQKKSTDPVLHQNLDAASSAGVKLSSITKRAAAEALLRKIAQEGEGEEASPEQKEKAQKLQELLKSKQQEKASQGMADGGGQGNPMGNQMGGGGGNALGGGY